MFAEKLQISGVHMSMRERTDAERQRAAIRGVKRKKIGRLCVGQYWWGNASIILAVFVFACGHPPVSVLLYLSVCVSVCGHSVSVCGHSMSVSACVTVCPHSVKWNGRCCREYNRGPTEVASRHSSSHPLTLPLTVCLNFTPSLCHFLD